jgi:hypothetical protein
LSRSAVFDQMNVLNGRDCEEVSEALCRRMKVRT